MFIYEIVRPSLIQRLIPPWETLRNTSGGEGRTRDLSENGIVEKTGGGEIMRAVWRYNLAPPSRLSVFFVQCKQRDRGDDGGWCGEEINPRKREKKRGKE